MFLVEVVPLFRQLRSLPAGDVFQVDDGVGHAAVRPNDEPLEILSLSRVRIADLGVLGDREGQRTRSRPGPSDGIGNGAAVGNRNDFVVALPENSLRWQQR